MNSFFILNLTGLLYRFMHNITIFEPKSVKFGKHARIVCLWLYVITFATLGLQMERKTFFIRMTIL